MMICHECKREIKDNQYVRLNKDIYHYKCFMEDNENEKKEKAAEKKTDRIQLRH